MELEYKGEVHAEFSSCLVGQTFSEISDAPSCVRPAPITPKFSVSPYLICFAFTAFAHYILHQNQEDQYTLAQLPSKITSKLTLSDMSASLVAMGRHAAKIGSMIGNFSRNKCP